MADGDLTPFDKEMFGLIRNVLSSRLDWMRQVTDPRRNYDDECGYPKVGEGNLGARYYQILYNTEPIANRVVEVFSKESWQVQPQVYEDEDPEKTTPFEQAWLDLSKNLHGIDSLYQDEEGSIVWEYLRRADELSGIGQFGCILLGINDGRDLKMPLEGFEKYDGNVIYQQPNTAGTSGQYYDYDNPAYSLNPALSSGERRLMFMRVFPESLVQINKFDSNMGSPRFGQPLEYEITLHDPTKHHETGVGLKLNTVRVHWSRVVHIADNLGSSEVFAAPRIHPVLKRILDLQKLYGGSAEMYWRGAFPGYSLETEPGDDPDVDVTETRNVMEKYMNGLQRFIALVGWKVKALAPQVVDPSPQIERQIEAICIKLGIPKRIFMGTERGELASSQDDAAWNDCIRARQKYYITPKIIVPLVNRLIAAGILPTPKGFSVFWPDLTSQTAKEKSQVAFQKTQALAQYVTSGASSVMGPVDYLVKVQGFSEREAQSIHDEAKRHGMIPIPESESEKKAADAAVQKAKESDGGSSSGLKKDSNDLSGGK